jgi:DNA-binding transcriptional ArsR family regulator
MRPPYDDIAALNRLIHEPARLAIVTVLAACEKADFVFMANITGLTKGNLSSHASKLQQAGMIEIEKVFEGSYPVTFFRLTSEGRERLEEYWARFDNIRQVIRAQKPATTP